MSRLQIENKELNKLNNLIVFAIIFLSIWFSIFFTFYFLFFLITIFIFLSKSSGVEIDFEKKLYRKYSEIFLIRKGQWKELNDKIRIVILQKKGIQTTTGTLGTGQLETISSFFELYFMDVNHINRFFLHSSSNKNEIFEMANNISKQSGLKLETYNPVI